MLHVTTVRSRFSAAIGMIAVLSLAMLTAPVFAKAPPTAVNINTATVDELKQVKGIGDATAKKIIANRPYASVDELSKAGMAAGTLAKLKPSFTVGDAPAALAKTPLPAAANATTPATKATRPAPNASGELININTAAKEQLDSIPGIGAAKAQAIIDGRPYATVEDIMKVKGIKQGIFDKIKGRITTK